MSVAEPRIDVLLAEEDWRAEMAMAARRTLCADPPTLDPVWFYDERGSRLFDEITRLPEYYLTRAERGLLSRHAPDISALGADTLVELGSGTADKAMLLLDPMIRSGLHKYVPFDVSETTLREAIDGLTAAHPSLQMHGVVGDFRRHLGALPAGGRRVVALLGSTIGNLAPADRHRFLVDLDCVLDRNDRFLLGIDLVKAEHRLVRAYDDAAGVTAEFNRNALRVLNAELGSDFDPSAFDHVARWDPDEQWMEMRLRAGSEQVVTLPGLEEPLRFAPGREIRTEISAKFTVEGMRAELWDGGFVLEHAWVSDNDEFALLFAHPYC
jgi:L-histidine Nalpha-methyltransferase